MELTTFETLNNKKKSISENKKKSKGRIVEPLESCSGLENFSVKDLVETIQVEYWTRCPFPMLYEEIPIFSDGKLNSILNWVFLVGI